MLQIVTAVVRPALTHEVARAALIPTEPHAIAVYVLMASSLVLVWLGNRGSGGEDTEAGVKGEQDAPASADEEVRESRSATAAHGKRVKGGKGGRSSQRGRNKLTRAQKRRRGHINWIQ